MILLKIHTFESRWVYAVNPLLADDERLTRSVDDAEAVHLGKGYKDIERKLDALSVTEEG